MCPISPLPFLFLPIVQKFFGLTIFPSPRALRTGYGTHGDYVFGWKGSALQEIMDEPCYVNCRSMKTQSIAQMNACTKPPQVDEEIDGCKRALFPTTSSSFAAISSLPLCKYVFWAHG